MGVDLGGSIHGATVCSHLRTGSMLRNAWKTCFLLLFLAAASVPRADAREGGLRAYSKDRFAAAASVSTSNLEWRLRSLLDAEEEHEVEDDHDHDEHEDHDHEKDLHVHQNCTCSEVEGQAEEDDHDHDHDHDEEEHPETNFVCTCPQPELNGSLVELTCSTTDESDESTASGDEDDGAVETIKIIGIVVLFVEVFLFALLPIVLKRKFDGLEKWLVLGHAFSGGVLIAAGLTHILPEAVESSYSLNIGHYPLAYTMVVFGYYMIYFFEGVLIGRIEALLSTADGVGDHESLPNGISGSKVDEQDTYKKSTGDKPATLGSASRYLAAFVFLFALGVHAFFAGLGLGLAVTNSDAIALLIANIAHKAFEAFAVSMTVQRHGFPMSFMVFYFLIFASIAPLGVGIGWAIGTSNDTAFTVLLGLSAGTFLYIGATEVPLEMFHEDMHQELNCETHERRTSNQMFLQRILCFTCSLLGFLMIAALNFIDHGH